MVLEKNFSKVVFDLSGYKGLLTDELRQWIKENITDKTYSAGLKYVAYVFPKEFISKFTVEKLFENVLKEYEGAIRMYFDNFEVAYNWIKEK